MKNITRRNLTKAMLLMGAASSVVSCTTPRTQAVTTSPDPIAPLSPGPKPNVLVIMVDQQNFRTLGCYRELLPPEQAFMWGKTVVDTPNVDRIAKAGALCERFMVTSPSCAPSRAALLTGLYPQTAGVPVNNKPMNDSCVTFAQVLKDNGYATGYFGKWHLDTGMPGWAPKKKFGFDDNTYMWNRGHWKKLADTPKGPTVVPRDAKGKEATKLDNADEKSFTTDFLTTRTINFINKNQSTGKPFCVVLSIPDPHQPESVRKPYSETYRDVKWKLARTYNMPRDEPAPAWCAPMKEVVPGLETSTSQRQYFGMIKCIDDNVGRLLAALEKTGALDNTIIVYTSDHGDMRGEHRMEYKGNPMDGAARVPFLITYPGKIAPGTIVRDCAVSSVDFKPTLLALLGVNDTAKVEGRDLSKIFLGEKFDTAHGKDIVFTRCENWGQWSAAISMKYKLIMDNSTLWLTDFAKDPDELKNFAYDPAYAPIVKQMAADMLDYLKTRNDPHYTASPLGVKFLEQAAQGTIKKMTPDELKTAQKKYPMTKLWGGGKDD